MKHIVKALFNISNRTWSFEHDDQVDFDYFSLRIGFRLDDADYPEDGRYVTFQNLNFGYELRLNSEVLQSKSWPEGDISYESSDQDWIETDLVITPQEETTYTLFVWVENGGVRSEATYDITTRDYFLNKINTPSYQLPWPAVGNQWN